MIFSSIILLSYFTQLFFTLTWRLRRFSDLKTGPYILVYTVIYIIIFSLSQGIVTSSDDWKNNIAILISNT